MTKKEKAAQVVAILEQHYEATCSLVAEKDYELLFATRLSAQCTDARVNQVTAVLFDKYPTLESLAAADLEDLCDIVHPCGLFRTKARDLIAASRMLCEEYGGRLPDDMDALLRLPGVGRKIANLLLGDVYGQSRVVADTHCIRLAARFGFTPEECRDPLLTERTLAPLLTGVNASDFCHRIVLFGREVCSARAPQCDACEIGAHNLCRYKEKCHG